jgi:putative SOS response-associated peptidase YedK
MCGRFALFAYMRQLMEEFGLDDDEATEMGERYNVAPSQRVLAVVNDGTANRAETFKWGFIPHWAKGDRPRYMINARSETVAEKPTFRSAFRSRRCLVVADGFYEWKRSGKLKVPMFIRDTSGRPWGFAGIYETWTPPEGDPVTTCAIITTEANAVMSKVHTRMPAIIREEDRTTWLDPAVDDPEVLLPMLRPYESDRMEMFPVSDEVNSARNDHPGLVRRLDEAW